VHLLSTATSADASIESRVVILPVGSFEQHGPYLPLATDTIIASAIASEIAHKHQLRLLPPVTIGCSHEHSAWPGTVSISATTLAQVVRDVAASAAANGSDRLVLVNGHGGNYVLSNVVQEANVGKVAMTLFPNRDDWEKARHFAGLETSHHEDMHAGELETSLLLHLQPNLVLPGYETTDHVTERPHLLMRGMGAYTSSGVIGRPSLASATKGAAILEGLTKAFDAHLRILDAVVGRANERPNSRGVEQT
jgi:creatinine amidohydrolase